MSEERVIYTSLPEDLEVVSATNNDVSSLSIRIGTNSIGLTAGAYEAIGKPNRVHFLFGQVSRMFAIRPASTGGKAIHLTARATTAYVVAPLIVAKLRLPPMTEKRARSFPAQLVEGALLIGPLPEAQS